MDSLDVDGTVSGGFLKLKVDWCGFLDVPISLELVDHDGWTELERPKERQPTLLDWLIDNQAHIRAILEASIFEVYQQNIEAFRAAWGGECDKSAPYLSEPNEVWTLLSRPEVSLHNAEAELVVSLAATWDTEHGVTVVFKDNEVLFVE